MNIYAPANFSACRRYRFTLSRRTDGRGEHDPFETTARTMLACGINPSKADEERPDPTATRLCKLAAREGCARLVVVNAWPFVSPYPAALEEAWLNGTHNVPENALWVSRAVGQVKSEGGLILAAWGAHPLVNVSAANWLWRAFIAAGAVCLARNKDGSPKHPLYCRADSPLIGWPS